MTSDPPSGCSGSPSTDPGDRHSGEGLASVRPHLARTLADSAMRTADKQELDAIDPRPPQEPPAGGTPADPASTAP